MACVVVTPMVGVSTPKAFADWDRLRGLKPHSVGGLNAALKGRSSTFESAALVDPAADDSSAVQATSTAAELRSAQPGQRPGSTQTWTGEGARPHTCNSRASNAGKLTVSSGSDRMSELGRGLSAWLSEMYSSAPSDLLARGGRAENPLLWLVRAGIKNDFEEVVFPEYPELSGGKSALLRAGAKYASLSGSGSTLYGLFASRVAAAQAVARLREQGWAAQLTATLPRRAYWKRIVVG